MSSAGAFSPPTPGYVPHHDGLVQRGGFFEWYERWLDTGLALLAAPAPGAWYQRILRRGPLDPRRRGSIRWAPGRHDSTPRQNRPEVRRWPAIRQPTTRLTKPTATERRPADRTFDNTPNGVGRAWQGAGGMGGRRCRPTRARFVGRGGTIAPGPSSSRTLGEAGLWTAPRWGQVAETSARDW